MCRRASRVACRWFPQLSSSTSLLLAAGVVLTATSVRAGVASPQAATRVDQLLKADIDARATADDKPAAKSSGAYSSTDDAAGKLSAKPVSHSFNSLASVTAKQADDETYLRRASMDLIGKPPTPAEVTAFVLDPSSDKRAKLVDRLLARSDFGENWGRYWRDVIMYRRSEDRALQAAPALTAYLTEQFNKNTPWDEITWSFITA